MKEISTLDKFLLILGFLIVVGIFTLALVIYFKGEQCVINPCEYAVKNNISCYNPFLVS